MFSEEIRDYIEYVCGQARNIDDYEELDSLLCHMIDSFGEAHDLSGDERDRIQNEIYDILGK